MMPWPGNATISHPSATPAMMTSRMAATIMRLPEADVRMVLLLLHRRFPYEVTQAINSVVGRRST
jgi:hypothetical protein